MKQIIVILVLYLTSCNCKNSEESKAIYDELSLKSFVLETKASNVNVAPKVLDSILTVSSNDSTIFRQTITYLEKPFGDPNSSYRNEQLYSKLLKAKINSPWYIPYEKAVAQERIHLLQQNRVGQPANDFTYTTPAGYKKRMYDFRSAYTLLYFYNPECNACKQMKTALQSSSIISNKISNKQLTIVAIYTDKDEKLWLDYLPGYPDTWIHGRDENEYLYKNKVYDLRAIPTLYLLDHNKTVLLKDVTSLSGLEQELTK